MSLHGRHGHLGEKKKLSFVKILSNLLAVFQQANRGLVVYRHSSLLPVFSQCFDLHHGAIVAYNSVVATYSRNAIARKRRNFTLVDLQV